MFQSCTTYARYVRPTDTANGPARVNAHAVLAVTSHCHGSPITPDSHDPTGTRMTVTELPDRVVELLYHGGDGK